MVHHTLGMKNRGRREKRSIDISKMILAFKKFMVYLGK